MCLPGRKYSNGSRYRYGFNGKENDNEVKGEGNQQDYGMRIYDPRLGRFLSEDPITKKYPELTPYQFASNRPIDGIDQDGLEFLNYLSSMYKLSNNGVSYNGLTHSIDRFITLDIVYENVPNDLKNPQTCGFECVQTSFIKDNGVDFDPSKDPPTLFPSGKYHHKGAEFYGRNGGTSTNGIDGLKGNAIPNGGTGNINASNINSVGSALGPNGVSGFLSNSWNYLLPWSRQAAFNQEGELHLGFTGAVSAVDNVITNGIMQTNLGDVAISSQQRANLINFVADGSLNHDNSIESMKNALTTAFYGVQIIERARTTSGYDAVDPANKIKDGTKQAISDLNSQYKKAGGGNEFDRIEEFYNN